MNDNFILSLIEKFSEGSIASLELQQGDDYICLCKKEALTSMQASAPQTQAAPALAAEAAATAPVAQTQQQQPAASAQAAVAAAQDADLVQIKSPIVGTFYRAPSPDSPVYVEEGQAVKKGEPLCVLEAMKMMNTLDSEFDCTIEKILIKNGDLVEFDQPLFLVRKA